MVDAKQDLIHSAKKALGGIDINLEEMEYSKTVQHNDGLKITKETLKHG